MERINYTAPILSNLAEEVEEETRFETLYGIARDHEAAFAHEWRPKESISPGPHVESEARRKRN